MLSRLRRYRTACRANLARRAAISARRCHRRAATRRAARPARTAWACWSRTANRATSADNRVFITHNSIPGTRAGQADSSLFRGRPRGRLRGTTTPCTTSSPPQTPHGSRRARASARHRDRSGQLRHSALAASTAAGDSAKNRSGSSVVQQGSNTGSGSASCPGRSEVADTCGHFRARSRWSEKTERPRIPDGFRGLDGVGLTIRPAPLEEGEPCCGRQRAQLHPGSWRSAREESPGLHWRRAGRRAAPDLWASASSTSWPLTGGGRSPLIAR